MPKINVYLPDELADAVRSTGVPVSVVCQQALEHAVRRVEDVRAALAQDQPSVATLDQLTEFTERTRRVLAYAAERAEAAGSAVTTAGLLAAIVEDDSNLAFRVLQSAGIDLDTLLADLASTHGIGSPAADEPFSTPAKDAIRHAVDEAIAFGHNYVGCEHLLLALASAENDEGSSALAAQGIDYRSLRRSISSALTGYAHLRSQSSGANAPEQIGRMKQMLEAAIDARLQPLTQRLNAVEDALISGLSHNEPPKSDG